MQTFHPAPRTVGISNSGGDGVQASCVGTWRPGTRVELRVGGGTLHRGTHGGAINGNLHSGASAVVGTKHQHANGGGGGHQMGWLAGAVQVQDKRVSRWDNAGGQAAHLRNEARILGVGDENGGPLVYFQIPEGQCAVV